MPTSHGSIGKFYTTSLQEVQFARFLGSGSLKKHESELLVLTVPNKICFVLDNRLLEINKDSLEYGISGYAAKFGLSETKTVRLYDHTTGIFIKELLSEPNGFFIFHHLHPTKKYTLTTKDEDGILESVILDSITPKLINS